MSGIITVPRCQQQDFPCQLVVYPCSSIADNTESTELTAKGRGVSKPPCLRMDPTFLKGKGSESRLIILRTLAKKTLNPKPLIGLASDCSGLVVLVLVVVTVIVVVVLARASAVLGSALGVLGGLGAESRDFPGVWRSESRFRV